MKKRALLLALMMALALTACGGAVEEPQTEPGTPAEPASEGVLYTNGGLTLAVPADYDPLVVVETPETSEEGVLFAVTEKASREFGQQQHPGEDWGDGWLFSIGTADEDVLHGMLAYDLSGAVPFAQGEDGTYYIFYHPTDVRFVRESYDIDPDSDDWKAWTALNEWAWTVQETFAGDNGLTPRTFTNTAPDMILTGGGPGGGLPGGAPGRGDLPAGGGGPAARRGVHRPGAAPGGGAAGLLPGRRQLRPGGL